MSTIKDRTSIAEPFGMYRAESLKDAVYELFSKPSYFPELETHRACVLLGGRGTGKTTVLKCLSYDGKFQLEQRQETPVNPADWPYFGLYHKINTNRVTAFSGPELTDRQWTKVFGHYINVVFCNELIKFAEWYSEMHPGASTLDNNTCSEISESLYAGSASTQTELSSQIRLNLRRFERLLNNLSSSDLPSLSLQGQPIDDLCRALLELPHFKNKSFFFIVDEYENLLNYQQIILNTLIKHSGEFYTFKVGIKELGWRERATLNENEQLVSPADYERIDIAQRLDAPTFKEFAESVCLIRAQQEDTLGSITSLEELLPGLTSYEEAERLGVDEKAKGIRLRWIDQGIPDSVVAEIPSLELYFADFWATSQNLAFSDVLNERSAGVRKWKERFDNYRFSMLFTIKSKKSDMSKYYCGWQTYVLLANGNIRYLLELVGRSIQLNRKQGGASLPIDEETQTRAAVSVAKKNLSELEGLSVNGAQLTKLLLSLGKVFEVFASNPEGHAPEYTQFHFSDSEVLPEQVRQLLDSAVMHLALVRTESSKRMEFETRSSDYAVHPIFSPFFQFSYRRKRKVLLRGDDISGLISEPKKFIERIVSKHGIVERDEQPLQMQLFEAFYNNDG